MLFRSREQPDKFWSEEFGKSFTPRYALQLMGTEVGREVFHEDFWIIRLKKFMQENPNQNFVITDVRFQNELDFVHSMNGIAIEIERDVPPHWYGVAALANRGDHKAEKFMFETGVHESEWRWIGGQIDHKIINSGTVDDLKNNLIRKLASSFGSSIIGELN